MVKIIKILSAFVLIFAFSSLIANAQDNKRYLIYLKDKIGSPYNIAKPQEFLLEKAIQRRKNQNIAIQIKDLPVNASYIAQIQNQGATIWYASKWLNAVLIEANQTTLDKVKSLSFVKTEELVTPKQAKTSTKSIKNTEIDKPKKGNGIKNLEINAPADYGNAFTQVKMIGADLMHKQGFRGQGMTIAVFDSGFENAPNLPFFNHLFENNQILGTYNLVNNNTEVYNVGTHGLQVLSTIAAYQKGKMIGTAPEANFYLFRTEDTQSEYKIEEVNWLIAAEKADSLGVDVINSSLGYTTFDDESMNYNYQLLDGNTAIITQAADFAAATGMLVVTSAGNEGNDDWQYVSAPADADSVLTVGATDKEGNYVSFSSLGPTSDKRIKPNISAQGLSATVGTPSGYIGQNSGTSFSSPIICGFAAAFWQANPTLTNMEVIDILQASASQANQPDSLLGYGIPNFSKAQDIVAKRIQRAKTGFYIYPNPNDDTQTLKLILSEAYQGKDIKLIVTDSQGSSILEKQISKASKEYVIEQSKSWKAGTYIIKISDGKNMNTSKFVKIN